VAMGNRINNEPLLMDIAKTPHALIAGATGIATVNLDSVFLNLGDSKIDFKLTFEEFWFGTSMNYCFAR
jgi:hypothetical protein